MNSPLVAICGPTGSGKSDLGIMLAQHFSGEIINCDSLQVYRHFDIGTAKIPISQRCGIRHHLIDVADATKGFTAGEFTLRSRTLLSEITERRNLPIIVGGTGFYLRALLDGLSPAPTSDPVLRTRLAAREHRKPGSLHRILHRLNPPASARIHPNDIPKLIRALELRILSGPNPSEPLPRDALTGYRSLKIALFPPRAALYNTIDRRCQAMLDGGLVDEIAHLLAAGIPRDAAPFASLGYKEGLAILENRLTPAEALERMQRDTRRYAKRQITWFRHDPGIVPLEGFGDDPAVISAAHRLIAQLLNSL